MRYTGQRIASERRRQAIRHHEVAHAVVAARLGGRPGEIEIDGFNMRGSALIENFDALPVRSRLVVLMAGRIAAKKVDPCDYSGEHDAEMARELVSKWPNPAAALAAAREQAEKLVNEDWALIVRLAAELRDAGGLTADALTHLLPTRPATRSQNSAARWSVVPNNGEPRLRSRRDGYIG
jgi:hypothetical protein